jgi:hypothetical protein
MNTVTPLHSQVNGPTAPISKVVEWAEAQADKGDMGGASSRVRVTSLRQMAEQVAADEPQTAQFVLDNIDRLRDRWATKNLGGKAGTAKTYASRAKTTIEEYIRWSEAPGKYDPRRSPSRVDRAERKPPPKVAAPVEAVAAVAPPAVAPSPQRSTIASSSGELRSCPLGKDRDQFRYVLPTDGLTMKDAVRVAYHLITMADDYDATSMTPVEVMSAAIQRAQ